jgi:hypothetical protein
MAAKRHPAIGNYAGPANICEVSVNFFQLLADCVKIGVTAPGHESRALPDGFRSAGAWSVA